MGNRQLQFLEDSFFYIYNIDNACSHNPFLNLFVLYDSGREINKNKILLNLDKLYFTKRFFRPICIILLYMSQIPESERNS